MDVLKIATAGSVDDGKSTLIGRLLYDTKSLTADKITAIEESSRKKGYDYLDFSLATDGLVAEREQGITIDVAHIYFSTLKRSYIIADTPGHVEYTRNMVTGASTSQASIILVDARKGVVEQTYRHFFINNLLRIKRIIVAVNKMDLVDYSEQVFEEIKRDFQKIIPQSDYQDLEVKFIPVSALYGENITTHSKNMNWYQGSSILQYIESIDMEILKEDTQTRFSVQTVIRPKSEQYHDFRGFAGIVEGGSISVGDEVTVLPSMTTSRVKSIHFFDKEYTKALEGSAVTLTIENEVNISRGDLIVKSSELPIQTKSIQANVCWMDNQPLVLNAKYILQHNTNTMTTKIRDIFHTKAIDFPTPKNYNQLNINEIGRVSMLLSKTIFTDSYKDNKANGKFILIDTQTNHTAGVGFIN